MTPAEWVFGAITALGGLSGLGAVLMWRRQAKKLDADTRHVDTTTDLAVDAGEDSHWKAIVQAQTEALVQPLREEIAALRGEVQLLRVETTTLREQVETHRTRYWRAITYIRALLAWARHPSSSDAPSPPAELAVDI